MFSLYKNSYNITPKSELSIHELTSLIQTGYTADTCKVIREKKSKGENYKPDKELLPAISPHCTTIKRKLVNSQDFNRNFKNFSGYFYFDFDIEGQDPYEFKKKFIETYKDKVSLVSISSSEGGIGVLVKVKEPIQSKEQFIFTRKWISENIFNDEKYLDKNASDIGRLWFIPFDPEVYCNYEVFVEIPNIIKESKRGGGVTNQSKNFSPFSHTSTDLYPKLLDYQDTKKLKLKTYVEVSDRFFDFEEKEVIDIRYPKKIKDGKKHKIFLTMILGLLELNPDMPNEVYTYVYYVNLYRTGNHPMSDERLIEVFMFACEIFKREDFKFKCKKSKAVHFNESCKIDKNEKIKTSNRVNGAKRRSKSFEKVQSCLEGMKKNGHNISIRNIRNFCKVGTGTARRYMNGEKPDLEGTIEEEKIRLKSIVGKKNKTED